MSSELANVTPVSPAELAALAPETLRYVEKAISDSTRRAYGVAWRHFEAWADREGRRALPAEPAAVADYLAAHAETYAPATLAQRLAAIGARHEAAGHPRPTGELPVRLTHKGIRRAHRVAPDKADPLFLSELRAILAAMGPLDDAPLSTVRNAAVLLTGYAGAFRRSELVALVAGDVAADPDGSTIRLRSSKTDQEGDGRSVALPYAEPGLCATVALRRWLERADLDVGAPLFPRVDRWGNLDERRRPMSARAVCRLVKAGTRSIGLNPAGYSGHSLRRGFITEAIRAGADERHVMRHSGHRSHRAFGEYVELGSLFRDHPGRLVMGSP